MASSSPDVSQQPGRLTTEHDQPAVDIVPFEPWHLDWLQRAPSQGAAFPPVTMTHARALQVAGPSFSAFVGAHVVACAGVVEFWQGRSQVWAMVAEDLARYQEPIEEAVTRFLEGYSVRRVECVIDPRAQFALEWASRVGFVFESEMKGYTPGGDDQLMLVRMRTEQEG